MPSHDGGTRVVPDFSRTFLGDPVLSTGMAVPSTAESTFPQRDATACGQEWDERPDGRHRGGDIRERRRALASMSCKGPSVDRSCDTSGRSGFASGPSGPVTGHCGELPRRTDLLLCLIGTREGVRRRFVCPGRAARQELFGTFPLFSRDSACRPQKDDDLHRNIPRIVAAVDIPVDSYRRSVAQPGGVLERRGHLEQPALAAVRGDELEADRQAVRRWCRPAPRSPGSR